MTKISPKDLKNKKGNQRAKGYFKEKSLLFKFWQRVFFRMFGVFRGQLNDYVFLIILKTWQICYNSFSLIVLEQKNGKKI